jgi:ketosteroid isomerase-like protein
MTRHLCVGVLHALLGIGLLASASASAQGKAEQELIQIEKDWCTASLKRDGALLGRILADDYVGVTRTGAIEGKPAALASLKDTTRTLDVCTDSDFRVHLYGDAAIVIATATRSGTEKGVAFKDRRSVYTDTFIRKDNRWQCVASQSTPLLK